MPVVGYWVGQIPQQAGPHVTQSQGHPVVRWQVWGRVCVCLSSRLLHTIPHHPTPHHTTPHHITPSHTTPHHTTPQRQLVDLNCPSPAIASRSPVPHLSTSTSHSVFPSFLPLPQYSLKWWCLSSALDCLLSTPATAPG